MVGTTLKLDEALRGFNAQRVQSTDDITQLRTKMLRSADAVYRLYTGTLFNGYTPDFLTADEEVSEIFQMGCSTAEERREHIGELVLANIPFAHTIVKRYCRQRNYDDMLQEVVLGMVIAAQHYDGRYTFTTYATNWMKSRAITFSRKSRNSFSGESTAIRIGFMRLAHAELKYADREPHEGDILIAADLGIAVNDVSRIRCRYQAEFSLDDLTTTPFIEETPEDIVGREGDLLKVHNDLSTAMAMTLNERERAIVTERLMADEPLTLEELSKKFHVTRERVRQLEVRTKDKLRTALVHYRGLVE